MAETTHNIVVLREESHLVERYSPYCHNIQLVEKTNLREQLLDHQAKTLVIDTLSVELILAIQESKINIIWEPTSEYEGLRQEIEEYKSNKEDLSFAIGRIGSIISAQSKLFYALEDLFGVTWQKNMQRAHALAYANHRFIVGLGAGFGNILQGTPLIRKISEHLGAPIDVVINCFTHEAIALLANSPYVNMVSSSAAIIESKPYDKAFLSYNVGPLQFPLNSPHVVFQRSFYDMNKVCMEVHEAEFHFMGTESLYPDIEVTNEEKKRYFLSNYSYKVDQSNKVIGLCDGRKDGFWENRSWNHFEQLAHRLKEEGYEVWSFGAHWEYIPGTVNKTGMKLRESLYEMSKCAYFIANDGGTFHMAECMGIPCVVLFGPTSVIKNGPLGHNCRIVHARKECSPCQYKVDFYRCDNNLCMQEISVEHVLQEFKLLKSLCENGTIPRTNPFAQIIEHERKGSATTYREEHQNEYREESFKYYIDNEQFLHHAIEGNIRINNIERAQLIHERAKNKWPEAPLFDVEFDTLVSRAFKFHSVTIKPEATNIDVYMTTCQRPHLLAQSLPLILEACNNSPYQHRIMVIVDNTDAATLEVLRPFLAQITLLSLKEQLGLPLAFNMLHEYSKALAIRSEVIPDFICYIQDDVLLGDVEHYFEIMVDTYREIELEEEKGFISGYYTPLHPGFEQRVHKGIPILLSDSFDGKNLMAPPEIFYSTGKLTYFFPDGAKRGNPGPVRGSQFDLWQWHKSPNSTAKQGRINIIIPNLCNTAAESALESTWNNPGDHASNVVQRIIEGRIYDTRNNAVNVLPEPYRKFIDTTPQE